MKKHTLILDSMSQGCTYLHIPINTLCPLALNVDIFRNSAALMIVLTFQLIYYIFRNIHFVHITCYIKYSSPPYNGTYKYRVRIVQTHFLSVHSFMLLYANGTNFDSFRRSVKTMLFTQQYGCLVKIVYNYIVLSSISLKTALI